jgi:indoleacetamide hydrolase
MRGRLTRMEPTRRGILSRARIRNISRTRSDKSALMKRRDFLKVTTAFATLATASGCSEDTVPQRATTGSDDRLVALTAVQAVSVIRQGEVSAERYATALLARAERLRDLNAYIALNGNGLLEGARQVDAERRKGSPLGAIAGLPLLVKDNIDTASLPTTAGCRGLAQNQPKQDAAVLKKLLSAGALLMAKMNMGELALSTTSTNAAYGAVRNPYDRRMISGGSSGGTGAGIAGRMAPVGLGTDTGGSVRTPAALCGVVGFRPSVGNGEKRYSMQGVVPISHTRDTVGPMGRTVGDVALLDSVITGQPVPQPVALNGLRLGIPRALFWEDLDNELAQIAESALDRLKAAGAVLIDVNLSRVRDFNPGFTLTLFEFRGNLEAYLTAAGGSVTVDDVFRQVAGKDVADLVAQSRTIPRSAYDRAMNVLRPQLQKTYIEVFAQHALAAIVFPTTPVPALPISENGDTREDTVELNGKRVPRAGLLGRNTTADTAAGIPGLSVPIGMTRGGLPIGLEFDGLVNSDRMLLGIGMSVESELGVLPPPPL